MALFAFLVAAMVCVVILGAATSAVRQAKQDQQHQQDMLLLQSAAQLITNEVNYTVVEKIETTDYTYKNNTTTTPSRSNTTYSFSARDSSKGSTVKSNTLVSEMLRDAIEDLYPGGSDAASVPQNKTFTLKVTANQNTDESFEQDVSVTFMYVESASGSATASGKEWRFLLSTKGGSERTEHTLFVDFQLLPQASTTVSTPDPKNKNRNSSTTTTYPYKWSNPYYSSTEDGLGEEDAS